MDAPVNANGTHNAERGGGSSTQKIPRTPEEAFFLDLQTRTTLPKTALESQEPIALGSGARAS